MVEREPKKKRDPLSCILVCIGLVVLASILVPNFIRARASNGPYCKSNMKNIGTALEMYCTDYQGRYPPSLSRLTPKYMKTIPLCPLDNKTLYHYVTAAAYNTGGFTDYYFINCNSAEHAKLTVPLGYPQYDGIQGLIER